LASQSIVPIEGICQVVLYHGLAAGLVSATALGRTDRSVKSFGNHQFPVTPWYFTWLWSTVGN